MEREGKRKGESEWKWKKVSDLEPAMVSHWRTHTSSSVDKKKFWKHRRPFLQKSIILNTNKNSIWQMSSSSSEAKNSVIVCFCLEAVTDGTIHRRNDERWGSSENTVKERGRRGLDGSYLCFTTDYWCPDVRVFELKFKAWLQKEASRNKR